MPTLQTRPTDNHTWSEVIESYPIDHITHETIEKATHTALITADMVAKTLANAMSERPPLAALGDIAAQEAIEW